MIQFYKFTKMVNIVPAILATTEEEYKHKVQKIEACSELAEGWVQIDLMDNHFVQNKSISPQIIAKYPTDLNLEVQLMVEYPDNWIDELVKTHVKRIIFPVEDNGTQEKIQHLKNHEIKVGLSLNPQTPVSSLESYLANIDAVLVMGVDPGFGGQQFKPETLEKIKELTALRTKESLSFLIGVDGGVNPENAKSIVEAGADYLVVGSALFEYDNLQEGLGLFWEKFYD